MTNPSEVVADLRIAAEDARRFSAALFDRGYVRREGVRPFSELLERAADTIDRLTSTGEAVAWRTDIFENLPNGKLTRLILDAAEVKDPDPDWKPLFYASPREGHVEVPREGNDLIERVDAIIETLRFNSQNMIAERSLQDAWKMLDMAREQWAIDANTWIAFREQLRAYLSRAKP